MAGCYTFSCDHCGFSVDSWEDGKISKDKSLLLLRCRQGSTFFVKNCCVHVSCCARFRRSILPFFTELMRIPRAMRMSAPIHARRVAMMQALAQKDLADLVIRSATKR